MPNKAPTPPKANAKNNNVNSEIRSYPLMAHNLSYQNILNTKPIQKPTVTQNCVSLISPNLIFLTYDEL